MSHEGQACNQIIKLLNETKHETNTTLYDFPHVEHDQLYNSNGILVNMQVLVLILTNMTFSY